MRVEFSYLDRQFEDPEPYLDDLRELVRSGDFTLGAALHEFERRLASVAGVSNVVGVGSGTDAIILSLQTVGVGPGDEVITTPMTFIATVGAIAMTGATPVFVDSADGFVIDPQKIEAAVTSRTKAILPVHYTGNVADMPAIMEIANKHQISVVEDACQAIGGSIDGHGVGSWGATGCISLHPLKNINVWGEGGAVLTQSAEHAEKVRMYRNHGLINRDESIMFGRNSRLHTLQAVIGNRLLQDLDSITAGRIAVAQRYDQAFRDLEQFVHIPNRRPGVKHVYHLYMIQVERRDELLAHLLNQGVDAKIHYPIPIHLQEAARDLGYQEGDFPVAEEICRTIISLPCHQHLTPAEVEYVIQQVTGFYQGKTHGGQAPEDIQDVVVA